MDNSLEMQLVESLQSRFGRAPQPSESLATIGIDSVGMAEFTFEIEQNYGIRVDESIFDVDTVQDLAVYIRERMPAAH